MFLHICAILKGEGGKRAREEVLTAAGAGAQGRAKVLRFEGRRLDEEMRGEEAAEEEEQGGDGDDERDTGIRHGREHGGAEERMASGGDRDGGDGGKERRGECRGHVGEDEGEEAQRGWGERGRREKEKTDRRRMRTPSPPTSRRTLSPCLPIAVRVAAACGPEM